MSRNKVFRKVSLERLASPERLDELMQITDPRGWIALASIFLLIATAVTWSIFGTLREKVSGSGILVRSGGVLEVVADTAGRITDFTVQPGDVISEGQVVAWIAQPDMLEQLQDAKRKLEETTRRHEENARFAREDAKLQSENLRRRADDLTQSIHADKERLVSIDKRLKAEEELLEKGLIARPTLLATQQLADSTLEKIRASESELQRIEVQELSIDNRLRETLATGELQVREAQGLLDVLERKIGTSTKVASQYNGRILEVMTEPGQIVQRGQPVLSLDLSGNAIQDLIAVIYVPSVHGKKIKPGMEIQISPTTIAQEEYGMMVGRVTFASNYPATPRGMQRVLKNPQLVSSLTGGGAPYEVHAELVVDPDTPSQYRWTSSEGPPTRIQSGTVAAGFITVKTQRPIARILPILRQWSGIGG